MSSESSIELYCSVNSFIPIRASDSSSDSVFHILSISDSKNHNLKL